MEEQKPIYDLPSLFIRDVCNWVEQEGGLFDYKQTLRTTDQTVASVDTTGFGILASNRESSFPPESFSDIPSLKDVRILFSGEDVDIRFLFIDGVDSFELGVHQIPEGSFLRTSFTVSLETLRVLGFGYMVDTEDYLNSAINQELIVYCDALWGLVKDTLRMEKQISSDI